MKRFRLTYAMLAVLTVGLLSSPQMLQAQENWKAVVGAQNADMGHQALAFLPNELWIHAGDTITWTAEADDIHTVTFLKAGQVVPPFTVGCPGYSPSGVSFDGSHCVSTPPLARGQTFAVLFPAAGNYKVECLVHTFMTGTIHVLATSLPLPHNQDYYNDQAAAQKKLLYGEADRKMTKMQDDEAVRVYSHHHDVAAGIGEAVATAGGTQVESLVRFVNGTIKIHEGDTVEWSNLDPQEPHTITFGKEPANPFPPSPNVTLDADGVRHASVGSTATDVHSGFIEATAQDQTGRPLTPLDNTRFRITFTEEGTYPYRCVLHDNLGMVGSIIVLP